MRMTISTDGFMNLVLEKAVKLGVAKTKNEAIRMGILSFNKEHGLIKDIEQKLVTNKLKQEEKIMKETGKKYLDEKQALKSYKHLQGKI
jgi:small nuclear ribonucleoprotein (snRNP)-like protein